MDKAFENLSILKDIWEIDDLLNGYCQNGYIDREKAILKIRKLRIKNSNIRKAAMTALPSNAIPFSQASDSQLAGELNAYRAILVENYLRNTQEDTHANT